jgi:predicted ATPase
MRLQRLYVRFYKSFNYDYERKAHPSAKANAWELTDQGWYPFVRVDIDPAITAVVGANEAGKSHLLDAIKKLLTGNGIERRDFCRYSNLYSVEAGEMRTPDFGGEFLVESDADAAAAATAGVAANIGETILFFRPGSGTPFLLASETADPVAADDDAIAALEAVLPQWAELQTEIGIPDSVPISVLAGRSPTVVANRGLRLKLLRLLTAKPWKTPEELAQQQMKDIFDVLAEQPSDDAQEQELGRQLLVEIARIDRSAFRDLEEAMQAGREGQVNGLIQEMNNAIARHLNLRRWWSQDRDFQLRVSPREHELVFTIRDRTGTDYSFTERSRGLRYFLSYYVQLRAHVRPADATELLLMDEPDAYLSSTGQQDLLRILEHYAIPDDGARRDQVVYVTHSPFLINRNAGHRIRVVDKGRNEEGTRVVRDATKNNYEPLRSSFGPFVGETAFIGGMNLLVEGLADQILLAGISTFLRNNGVPASECLDLNESTLVPAGSASSVPYLAYLARGRDEIKPPCVALLDSDDAGDQAVKKLLRSEASGKQILEERFVIQLGAWAQSVASELDLEAGVTARELEDLIPIDVAVQAARRYAVNLVRVSREQAAQLTVANVRAAIASGRDSAWDALSAAFADAFDSAHIDKVGFAKELVGAVSFGDLTKDGAASLARNFRPLIARLAELLREAARHEDERRRARRLDRVVGGFVRDYAEGATRDRANVALKEIESSLGQSADDEATLVAVMGIRRDFKLSDDPNSPVPDYAAFVERLEQLRYQRRIAYQDNASGAIASAPEKAARKATKRSAKKTAPSAAPSA